MTDKQTVDNEYWKKKYADIHIRLTNQIAELQEQFKHKEQEYEELRQYHNKCCTEFEKEKQALLEKYNQVSANFYNGDYCNTEHCSLFKAKEQECEELKDKLNCCFCSPYVELNDIEKRRKCVEVTECFRRKLDKLKAEREEALKQLEFVRTLNTVQETEIRKLSKTLAEIKEIAKEKSNVNDWFALEILQKINEVENEHKRKN